MRQIIAALAVFALTALASAAPALADQDDARLPKLFEKLRTTESLEAALRTEQRIWAIWLEHENPQIEELMAAGTLAMSTGALSEAWATFDRMIALAPDYAEAWNKRATVAYALGDYEASLSDIEETLRREPRHFGALSGKGLVYSAMDQLEQALEAYHRTLEVHPHARGAQINIERLKEAIQARSI